MKRKVWKEGAEGQPKFPNNYKVTKRWAGNCTSISNNSNKFYHIEIQVASSNNARIFTMYGRVGKTPAKEYRYYSSETSCILDYEALIKKKRDRKKNPYREVDLAITSIGSEGAKEIKKPMTGIKIKKIKNSSLHLEVQKLISGWFGSTGNFINMTLKCPLGQLTKEQIDKGRLVLDDCKKRINNKIRTGDDVYDALTSQFYSLVPHILPHKINPNSLRLNTLDRIMEKHNTLDTFLDAKNVASVLSNDSDVDDQYKKLNVRLDWIDPKDPRHKWIEKITHNTRAKNHAALGKIKIHNIFEICRPEHDDFYNRMFDISKQRKRKEWTWPDSLKNFGVERPDLSDEERKLYEYANVIPLFHGSRNENMTGIVKRGLLIRPSGAVYTGSAFGDGAYFGLSSKACGYSSCTGSYWARGNSRLGYVFLVDVGLGDPKIVCRSGYYTSQNILPNHSVWAKAGGYLVNDEFILYHQTGSLQQHKLRYILEIETRAK